jgi:hypothetical protein
MRHSKLLAAALSAAMLLGASAEAGSKFTGTGAVVITLQSSGAGSASGYLGHIWNAPSTSQWIGCNYSASATGDIMCHARSDGGQQVFCASGSKFLAESLAALGTDVLLTFTWNASGVCESITVSHSSGYAPKL